MKSTTKILIGLSCCTTVFPAFVHAQTANIEKPNVIFIYADDLGIGMLSCMGQRQFTTPNIDKLFCQGTQFTHAYGCMVSAASRASLLTGYYDVRKDKFAISQGRQLLLDKSEVTDNLLRQIENRIDNNDIRLQEGDYYLPQIFKQAGYTTCQVGKLEYGWTASRKQVARHGWDHYYGYLDHVACHGYYPPYMFEDDSIVMIDGNTRKNCGITGEPETDKVYTDRWNMSGKKVYSQDLFIDKILQYINDYKDKPFFIFHPTQLPHGPVMVPKVNSQVKENPNLNQIEKEYASMVLYLDSVVGVVLNELKRLNIDKKTMIVFASDNGHEIYYAKDGRVDKPYGKYNDWSSVYYSDIHGDVFNGNGGVRGFKRQNSEGGPRVPFTIYMPGTIPAAVRCEEFVSMCDLIPTFAEMLNVPLSSTYKKDGVSLLGAIMNGNNLPSDRYIVYTSYQGPAIVNNEGFKVRYNTFARDYDMYYLLNDPQERNNIANTFPNRFRAMKKLLIEECGGDISNGICTY